VVEAARRAGVGKLVYAASSSCYGIPDAYPTPEDAPLRPQYPYALTKMMGEHLVVHWANVYGMRATSLRLFNVFGPRSRTSGTYGAVFGVFLAQKLAGKPYTVVGDGTQTRDFTFVADVAAAFVAAGESVAADGRILNVGSGAHQSVNRLVELLGGEVVHIPKRPGEPDCTFADTAQISDVLGWRAATSFEEGVARVVGQIESWRDAPVWTPETIAEATEDWFRYLGRDGSSDTEGEGA
jgi:UDP-glucose 4-epimerase